MYQIHINISIYLCINHKRNQKERQIFLIENIYIYIYILKTVNGKGIIQALLKIICSGN